MAFNLLKIFKKKEIKKQEEKIVKKQEINIAKIPGWIKENLSGDVDKVQAQAKNIYIKILNSFSNIENSLQSLEQAEFEPEDKTYVAVNMVKATWVKRVYSLINSYYNNIPFKKEVIPTHLTYPIIKQFYSATSETLSNLKNLSPKQAYLLSNYFKRESEKVINTIKRSEETLNELKVFLDSKAKVLWLIQTLDSRVKEVVEGERKYNDLTGKEKEIQDKIKSLIQKEGKLNSELETLLKSKEWVELSNLHKIIEEFEQNESEVEYKIGEAVAVLKRPLKKFEHLVEKGYSLPKEQKLLLEKFLHSPLKTILSGLDLKNILSEVKELVENGGIAVKNKERDKINESMEKLKSGYISNLKQKYKAIVGEKEKYKEKLKLAQKITERKNEIESATREAKDDIEKFKKLLIETEEEKSKVKANIIKQKEDIEELILKETGKKVEIKVL